MNKLKLILATAMVVGLSFAFAGSAFAAAAGCGQCHGAYVNDNHGGKTLMPGVSVLEDTKTPQAGDICNNNGRGLHGVHMNYSSATYGKKSTTRGNCNYCHNEHIHENAYVEMEGYAPFMALGTIASTSAVTLGSGGSGYAVGDVATINGGTNGAVTVSTVNGSGAVLTFTVSAYRESYGYSVASGIATTGGTGTGLTVNITSITNYGLRQLANSTTLVVTGTGMTANGLDITQMTGNATCTGACHKGTSATNPAPWGNITSVGMNLSCNSCHGDVANNTGLTGAHAAHLASGVQVNGGLMGAAGNAGCLNCHPDNRNDLWSQGRADDGSKKAYPHASDGTNVVSDNASIIAGISATKAGLNTTCAASCHPRSATITWGGTGNCDMCHYYNATPSSATNTGTGALGGSHNAHFDQGVTCTSCHGTLPTNTAHASALPVVSTNATIDAGLGFNSGTLTCSSTGASCHGVGNTTPAWGSSGSGCATCHSYPGVAGRDWTGYNGHMARASTLQNATTPVIRKSIKHLNVATAYNASTDTYAGVTGDVNKCGKCHAGATHRNGTVNVADSNSLGQCSSTSFTYNNVSSNPTNRIVNCTNVSCHFGKKTPNWF